MHPHQLLDHPLFDERPRREVLEPFGFEVDIQIAEPPIDPAIDDPAAIDAYAEDPQAYIDALEFAHPAGFTEIDRGEDADGDIYSLSVRAKTVFAQLLLCADSEFAGLNNRFMDHYMAVYRERMRQISTEGFSRERDDQYTKGELATAAACYALAGSHPHGHGQGPFTPELPPRHWPWDDTWWKPSDNRRDLVKAGALILAEIERLDRAAARQGGEG